MGSMDSIQLAYEFVLSIIMGMVIGYILSNYYDNKILIIVGFIIGVLMAFLRFAKMITRMERK